MDRAVLCNQYHWSFGTKGAAKLLTEALFTRFLPPPLPEDAANREERDDEANKELIFVGQWRGLI